MTSSTETTSRSSSSWWTWPPGPGKTSTTSSTWFNVYNRVVVDLVTHDAQGITRLDFELADHMQVLAAGG
jgi:Pterin 4 alpha carbinolamine dehydratase